MLYSSIVYFCKRQKENFLFNTHQFLIAFDQTCNVLAGLLIGSKSYADETFSSRCWRWKKDGIRAWPANVVDTIMFFDFDKVTKQKHCELSYISEVKRLQSPPEER